VCRGPRTHDCGPFRRARAEPPPERRSGPSSGCLVCTVAWCCLPFGWVVRAWQSGEAERCLSMVCCGTSPALLFAFRSEAREWQASVAAAVWEARSSRQTGRFPSISLASSARASVAWHSSGEAPRMQQTHWGRAAPVALPRPRSPICGICGAYPWGSVPGGVPDQVSGLSSVRVVLGQRPSPAPSDRRAAQVPATAGLNGNEARKAPSVLGERAKRSISRLVRPELLPAAAEGPKSPQVRTRPLVPLASSDKQSLLSSR